MSRIVRRRRPAIRSREPAGCIGCAGGRRRISGRTDIGVVADGSTNPGAAPGVQGTRDRPVSVRRGFFKRGLPDARFFVVEQAVATVSGARAPGRFVQPRLIDGEARDQNSAGGAFRSAGRWALREMHQFEGIEVARRRSARRRGARGWRLGRADFTGLQQGGVLGEVSRFLG